MRAKIIFERKLTMDTMLSKALRDFLAGPLNQLIVNLGGDDGDQWEQQLKQFLRKEPCWTNGQVTQVAEPKPTPSILRLISESETITISATDGKETIAQASDVFAWIDPDFKNYGTNVAGAKTEELNVAVHEMIANSDFQKIFGSFGTDLDKLCTPQSQIVQFARSHKKWLRTDGYATFFLFKVGDEFFVAGLYWRSASELGAIVDRLSDDFVWSAEGRRRVVVP